MQFDSPTQALLVKTSLSVLFSLAPVLNAHADEELAHLLDEEGDKINAAIKAYISSPEILDQVPIAMLGISIELSMNADEARQSFLRAIKAMQQ